MSRFINAIKSAIDPRLCPNLSVLKRESRRKEIKDIYSHLLAAAKISQERRETLFIIPYKFNRFFICSDLPSHVIYDEGFIGHQDTLRAAMRLLNLKNPGVRSWKLTLSNP